MQKFEYKVVPAPQRGEKVRGAKTTADRFAAALMTVMNEMGRDGWEYLRADTLPCEERVGLTGKTSSFLHMLVFRRALKPEAASAATPAEAAGKSVAPAPPRTLLAVAPEGAAPRVTPFVKPVAGPAPGSADGPARDPSATGE